jgi:hypothetical protein
LAKRLPVNAPLLGGGVHDAKSLQQIVQNRRGVGGGFGLEDFFLATDECCEEKEENEIFHVVYFENIILVDNFFGTSPKGL